MCETVFERGIGDPHFRRLKQNWPKNRDFRRFKAILGDLRRFKAI